MKAKKGETLQSLKERAKLGGGGEKIKAQHEKGKLTARQRLEKLLDPDSFMEINLFTAHRSTDLGMAGREVPGEGVVTGSGTVNGQLVFVFAQDFTAMGGTLGEAHAKKIVKIMDLALENGAPIIGLNDSGGARIQEGVDALDGYGDIFYRNTIASGVIPQIAAILGPCAGGAVYSPALMDFTFMVEGISQMFITGPQVVKAVTGQEVSPEELGGAATHNQLSGVAHFNNADEESCLNAIRELLSYLPANNMENPPETQTEEPPAPGPQGIRDIVPEDPKRLYDMKEVIRLIVDGGYFFEVHPYFAPNIIVGFARLGGKSVGIVANQPKDKGGVLDIDSSDKASRFIRFCDAFNIPLVNLVDVPGYLPGTEQEYGGVIRHGAKLLYAYSEATVPKVTLIARKAYGGAFVAMCSQALGADFVFAWPNAEIAVMGPEGAANIIYRKEIKGAENPEEVRQEKIKEYRDLFANPLVAARRGMVHDIIEYEATRARLIYSLDLLSCKKVSRPPRKHGNFPV